MILVKKSAGCKCHIPTIKVGPVSVHLLLNIYSKTRNSCVSLFRLNNETTEEKKKTLITDKITGRGEGKPTTKDSESKMKILTRQCIPVRALVIWYSDHNLRC